MAGQYSSQYVISPILLCVESVYLAKELTEGKGNYVQSVSLLSAVVIKKRNGACFE